MDLKKQRKIKKDSLEKAIESAERSLDDIFNLLEKTRNEFIQINKNDEIVITHNILMEIAEEMGKDHIDFMAMA